ncbi:MAG: hypothetical protein O2818_03080 [Bacteroidetes bacterium]|nr:hypothetical protein [Bacteroidota bacterium]MDA1335850.1 hypothetical protein [Bacteroidota bacterium]
MRIQFPVLKVIVLVLGSILVVGCADQTEKEVPRKPMSKQELIEFNRLKVSRENEFLTEISRSWQLDGLPHYFESNTGLRIWSKESVDSLKTCVDEGAEVCWAGTLMLMDSTILMEWTRDAPLCFQWNRSDWPAGFHELAQYACTGDQIRCLVPTYLGWGLTGWSPIVPPESILMLDIEPIGLEVSSQQTMDDAGMSWNTMLDLFEMEDWRGFSNGTWIRNPQLAASPCLAWFESNELFSDLPVRYAIELRTFRLDAQSKSPVDLGLTKWEFQAEDQGQLVPALNELITQYPQAQKWECWCPANRVYGSEGLPSIGISSSDVVGFQFTLSQASAGV